MFTLVAGVFPKASFTARDWLDSQGGKRTQYLNDCDTFLVDPHKQVCIG
jgi:hypothetical protein